MSEGDELQEDQEIKNEDNTMGGQSKSHNKICFGVFASLSHRFILRQEKFAEEISVAMQSAFRVLSLTRPELPLLTQMMLKSEGFSHYEVLAEYANELFFTTQKLLQCDTAKQEPLSVTLRDVKRLVLASVALRDKKMVQVYEQEEKVQVTKQK